MKFRYLGNSTRIIESNYAPDGAYVWNEANGHVQDVTDPALIENLQTYPYDDWEEVDEPEPDPADEPVMALRGIGPARSEELAGLGIRTVGELAVVNVEELLPQTGASRAQVEGWVAQAQALTGLVAGAASEEE